MDPADRSPARSRWLPALALGIAAGGCAVAGADGAEDGTAQRVLEPVGAVLVLAVIAAGLVGFALAVAGSSGSRRFATGTRLLGLAGAAAVGAAVGAFGASLL